MPEPPSAQHVVETLMEGISCQRLDRLHELYAEDAVIEFPFALPERRWARGREAIRGHFAALAAAPLRLETRNMVVHTTADPEVVVAEWDYDGLVTTTGRAFRVSNVQVSRVRNGKIVASRDYHNHAMMAHVMGRLPSLVAAFTVKHVVAGHGGIVVVEQAGVAPAVLTLAQRGGRRPASSLTPQCAGKFAVGTGKMRDPHHLGALRPF